MTSTQENRTNTFSQRSIKNDPVMCRLLSSTGSRERCVSSQNGRIFAMKNFISECVQNTVN